jgi:hypothetical protein
MIVWIASYPRSGNFFLRTVLWESFGRVKSGTLYSQRLESYAAKKGYGFQVDSDSLARLSRSRECVFVKTHALPRADDDSPAIYLVRDGRDAVLSYARFAIATGASGFENRSVEEATEVLIRRRNQEIGGWSENVRSWTRRDAPTAIVRFEELIDDPIGTIQSAVASIGVSLPEPDEAPSSFTRLHEEEPVLFSKGKVGGWKYELPDRLQRLFWQVHGAEMLLMGYPPERLPFSDSAPA